MFNRSVCGMDKRPSKKERKQQISIKCTVRVHLHTVQYCCSLRRMYLFHVRTVRRQYCTRRATVAFPQHSFVLRTYFTVLVVYGSLVHTYVSCSLWSRATTTTFPTVPSSQLLRRTDPKAWLLFPGTITTGYRHRHIQHWSFS